MKCELADLIRAKSVMVVVFALICYVAMIMQQAVVRMGKELILHLFFNRMMCR